uniref:Uncharacterized protein n=1 Tax=Zea mays TaxID=4577 RepID=C0PA64_MAIZE|nr:unknown [Zea mays]
MNDEPMEHCTVHAQSVHQIDVSAHRSRELYRGLRTFGLDRRIPSSPLRQPVAETRRLAVGGDGSGAPYLGHVGEVARRELLLKGPVLQPAEEVAVPVREQLLAAELGQERVQRRRGRPAGAVQVRDCRHGRELRPRSVRAYEPRVLPRRRWRRRRLRVRCAEAHVAAGAGDARGGGRERRRGGRREGCSAATGRHGLLLELGVPVVLDVVIGPAGELGRDDRPPAADGAVERPNDPVLLVGVAAVLDVRPQVVEPPQPAALAAPVQPCFLRQGDPVAADAVQLDVAPQLLVLLGRPGSPLHARLVAARRAAHVRRARHTATCTSCS